MTRKEKIMTILCKELQDMADQIQECIDYKELDLNDYNFDYDLYEALDYDGSLHEIIDGKIDVYYYYIRKWAVDNYNYVEDAIEEGLTEGVTDYHALIQSGQYVYFRELANEALTHIFDTFKEDKDA